MALAEETKGAPAAGGLSGAVGERQSGIAAVYSTRLNGHRTASGERYDKNALTAAHQSLPYGTRVKVTRLSNHRSVVVRVNDRGPTQEGRILDLSSRAARDLYMSPHGFSNVELEVVAPPHQAKPAHHPAGHGGHHHR
ncbi:MAG TPA: septal ring lytic transglycosylase RlpA family protein [Candidatus Bathyarchaeia archaeon]|nr:septal ring lytic transglycosylase RlpA family protein [Candidatus Bathyarchaeia archaeon]